VKTYLERSLPEDRDDEEHVHLWVFVSRIEGVEKHVCAGCKETKSEKLGHNR